MRSNREGLLTHTDRYGQLSRRRPTGLITKSTFILERIVAKQYGGQLNENKNSCLGAKTRKPKEIVNQIEDRKLTVTDQQSGTCISTACEPKRIRCC